MWTQDLPEMMYGTAWKKEDTTRLVELAVSQGFIAVDTANQPKHYQEALVGRALKNLAEKGIPRQRLFLQTKFTPLGGQGEQIPYDPRAPLATQVSQSFESSLQHLQTDYLDSWLLHGPYSRFGLGRSDWEVWRAMEEIQRGGRVGMIGISNVSPGQIQALWDGAEIKPAMVQNRCFAVRGWDREVRQFCRDRNIGYQGFSLLTANPGVLHSQTVADSARRYSKTPAQIVFRFAQQVGMLPLSGTTDEQHMRDDLEVGSFSLSEEELTRIETLEG
ncbi:MAG: aldo/keto reductase [Acidobacteriota bacterium]|nr:aldo/keto reductase [Acidobacteriota bacterium]